MEGGPERAPVMLFAYQDARGRITKRRIVPLREDEHYITGTAAVGHGVRTFLKERILQVFDDPALWEASPHLEPQPAGSRDSKAKLSDDRPQIAFTGFPQQQREELEHLADAAGLKVCKGVTTRLSFLCIGPNAGPSKLAKSRAQGVVILDNADFFNLLENGEIPQQ